MNQLPWILDVASCHAQDCSGVGLTLTEVNLASLVVINTELGFHARYDNKRENVSLIFDITEAENLELVFVLMVTLWINMINDHLLS